MVAMKTRNAVRSVRRGFTIIEVMIVLVIISLIGSIVAINFVGAAQEARIKTTKASLQSVQTALKLYHGTNGSYPTATGDISVLIQQNILQLGEIPKDAWGTPIQLYSDGINYTILSAGPDKAFETDDDLSLQPDHQ